MICHETPKRSTTQPQSSCLAPPLEELLRQGVDLLLIVTLDHQREALAETRNCRPFALTPTMWVAHQLESDRAYLPRWGRAHPPCRSRS